MSEYLDPPLKNVLAKCLAEIVERRPADPIDYLAKCLYRHASAEIAYHNKRIMITEMEIARLQMEEEEAIRMEKLNELRQAIKVLECVLNEQKMAREDFLQQAKTTQESDAAQDDQASMSREKGHSSRS